MGKGVVVKGIILAGGAGTRLHPATHVVSKQLLPVYDKPLIYYPLSVLMLAGIRDILVISTPDDMPSFQRLLQDGARWGLNFSYATQAKPNGLAEAFKIGADFIGNDSVSLILGDNIFWGQGLPENVRRGTDAVETSGGCVLFGHRVSEAERYGVAETDDNGVLINIEEKPAHPRTNLAVTGLYIYDNDVIEIARGLRPSKRGELEITDLNMAYIRQRKARLFEFGRGFTWLDTGTNDSMMEAGIFVQAVEHRQGLRIACVEEIALRLGYISADQCVALGLEMPNSGYGQYIVALAKSFGAV
jgi:glucose-1-phosphate thymidylyltransferase